MSRQKVPADKRDWLAPMRKADISARELRDLEKDEVGYIVEMTVAQARKLFPNAKGMPQNPECILFLAAGADGTPISLSEERDAAVGNILKEELTVAAIH